MGVGISTGVATRRGLFATLLFALLTLTALPAFPRTKLQGYVEQGGQQHRNVGIFGITRAGSQQTNPYTQQSYPNATVTVYLANSLTVATLYADPSGTAKSNPFTASSNAYWSFYIDDGTYDIRFSGGGIAVPFTWSGISTVDGGFAVSVTGFGAACDGTTDDTIAIQAAIDVVGPHLVQFPAAVCKTTDTITISQHRVNLVGTGQQSSRILFLPATGGKAGLHFTTGINAVLYQNSVENLTIYSTDTTLQKFGIQATDTSMLKIEDVAIYPFSGGTGTSVNANFSGGASAAIKLNGRELTVLRRIYANSDIALWIDDNPNFTIDVDHLHVQDFQGAATGSNPIVYISSGVNLTNVTFDGYQVWVTGGRGLYWVDTAATISSYALSINNVRHEQAASQQFVFHVEHNLALYNFNINNCLWGTGNTAHGVKLRKVEGATIRNSHLNGTGQALDVDTSVPTLLLNNFFTQAGATTSTGGLKLVEQRGRIISSAPHALYEYWANPLGSNFAAGRASYFMGDSLWADTGTLASGATTNIPSLGGAVNHATVKVRYKGATKFGSFKVYYDGAQAFLESTTDTARGTTETGVGNIANRITVHWQTAANVVLRNNLGESVSYSISIEIN